MNLEPGVEKTGTENENRKLGGVPGWILGTLGWPKKKGILWEIKYFVYSRCYIELTVVSVRSDKYDNLLVPIKNVTTFLCVTARYTINSMLQSAS